MPEDYGPIYQGAGHQWGIDPLLLQSMAEAESNQNPSATGPVIQRGPAAGTQAQGVMQFVPQTAARYGVDPSNPTSSIYGAGNYLADLMSANKGDLRQSLAAYGGAQPHSPYVSGIMDRYTQLTKDWAGGAAPAPPSQGSATPAPARRATTTFAPAGAAGDDASAKALIQGLTPHVDEHGAPLSAATPQAAGVPDPGVAVIQGLTPHVDENGAPLPTSSGQFLSAATSPGAKAVGTPIAEGQVPGPLFQAKINTATDPLQKARIAAGQLFPNDPNRLDRIIVGPEGRLAATDDQGKPYYIEPQEPAPLGMTRGEPGTPWRPLSPMAVDPYSSTSLAQAGMPPSFAPGNLLRQAGAELPSAAGNALQVAATPLGAVATGVATGGSELARQEAANLLDPNPAAAPPLDWHGAATDAAINALLVKGGGTLLEGNLTGAVEPADSWLAPRRAAEAGTPAPPAPEVQLNPAGDAAAPSGPYAASTPQEIAAIPNAPPPVRVPIVTQGQADARADDIIRYYAANGPTAPDSRVLVPNSPATLAQTTGNAGLATLERGARNLPDATNIFAGVDAAQQQARRAFVAKLIGTPEDLENLTTARDAATTQAREAAFADTTPTDPSAAVAEIDRVLAGPDGKRPGISGPLRQLRGLFYSTDPATGEQVMDSDPEMLYGVRKAVTDSLSPLARGTASDARAAAAQLQPVLQKLDSAIEAGAPGYSDYMKQFNEQSKPIDAMSYLQGRNLTDTQGNPVLLKVDSTIKDIQRQRTLQAGVRPADALSDEQLTDLDNLRDDLRRQANLAKGKVLGSNTMQNLATNQTMNALTGPVAQLTGKGVGGVFGGWPGYFTAGATENLLTGLGARGERMVSRALVDRLLNRNGLGEQALGVPPANVPQLPASAGLPAAP